MFLSVALPTPCDSDNLPNGYHKHPDSNIAYKLHHELKSFGDALRKCESEGTKLATPKTLVEYSYIKATYANPGIVCYKVFIWGT